ncbi:hypothetical protein [Parvimonas micra]|uniref:Uncharacterized protein n=1 Tax=Parvimonas micra TaxID=33033 RepID=A0A9X3HAJ2_9FIRM|nr:hypothetical protein [Parvimonas micra]MCZ7407766.1 hypothetical protein [Parvimonas micra]MCZ7410761.1 hypothetical protein [Parvimonas micra]MCZ7412517.1 hypothetical protein [Parvimonas micra]WBB36423.1 hypothetical protein NM218_05000 [Parvimonas micra]
MKELFEILVKKRTSVLIVLLAIFVAMVVTYSLSRLKNRFIKFIPAFILIIVGTVFLADGWTNILTARGINSLYYAMIIGTSGVVSLFFALILMNFKRK